MKCQHVGCGYESTGYFADMYCGKHQMMCAACDKDATLFTPEGHLCTEHTNQLLNGRVGYPAVGEVTRFVQEKANKEVCKWCGSVLGHIVRIYDGHRFCDDLCRSAYESAAHQKVFVNDEKLLAQIQLYNQICLLFQEAKDKVREADAKIEDFEDTFRSTDYRKIDRVNITSYLDSIKRAIGRIEKRVL